MLRMSMAIPKRLPLVGEYESGIEPIGSGKVHLEKYAIAQKFLGCQACYEFGSMVWVGVKSKDENANA